MRLSIFGATGPTGRRLVEQALARGHSVTAVARSPERMSLSHPQLQVVRGDVTDPTTIAAAIAGHDAVLSALGAPVGRAPVSLYSVGTANILATMAQHNVRRIVCVSAGGTHPGKDPNNPVFFEYVVAPLLLGRIFDDMRRMEDLLMASNTDWTIVRPPALRDTPPTKIYRVAPAYSLPKGWQIGRADLADFILDTLDGNGYHRQALAIAY